jgi:RNA polymerase-binding transcription factor DksA
MRKTLMADEIDLANDLIDSEVARALSRLRQNATQHQQGSEFCIDCGESVPEARQALGFKRCIVCAEEFERRKSLFINDY